MFSWNIDRTTATATRREVSLTSDPRVAMNEGQFDHHGARYSSDPIGVLADLRDHCPVARSEQRGGYWVLTRFADVERVARDYEGFSSDHDLTGTGSGYLGINIPETGSYRRNPVQIDPPEMLKYRQLLTPFFSRAAVERSLPRIERWVTACIDRIIESGVFDVVLDLAMPVPALFTADLLGLPLEDWENWSWPQHRLNFAPPGSLDSDAARQLMRENRRLAFLGGVRWSRRVQFGLPA